MTMPPGSVPPPIDDETLSAYLDGALDAAEAVTVADALRRDPALAARARETEAIVTLLRALPQPAPRRTFVLTPETAAPVRHRRASRPGWLGRMVPLMAATSAVAAVLLLALFIGDLRTDGFRAPGDRARMTARAVNEAAADAAMVAATPAEGPAASGALPPAPAATPAAATGLPSIAARPPVSAALPAPTATGGAVTAAGAAATAAIALPATLPPAVPTAVANARATATSAARPPVGGAVVRVLEEGRVPLSLVRAGEIALLTLSLAALGLAVAGLRARRR